MRLIAMLSYYRESPTWLAATVASLAKAGVDHVVAVDGPYGLFPGANSQPQSGTEEADAIQQTCYALGMGLTLHRPSLPWYQGEVAKRSFMFELALAEAEKLTVWLFWIDSDEVVHKAPPDLKQRLADAGYDMHVGAVTLWQRGDAHKDELTSLQSRTLAFTEYSGMDHRVLYRALPGLHVHINHAFVTDGEIYLRGRRDLHNLVEALDCHDVIVEHRHEFRDAARRLAAEEYYRLADSMGIERAHRVLMETPDGTVAPV
jgi:hypothetical protein